MNELKKVENKLGERKSIPLDEYVPNPRNDNDHKPEHAELLAKFMRLRGVRHPIIVSNQTGFIVAGHLRLMAAKILELETYPAEYQDFKNQADEYAFLSGDNNLARYAEFNEEKMLSNLEQLDIDVKTFDFQGIGLLDFGLPKPDVPGKTDVDSVPSIASDPISKRGDVWILGNHRVMCGDSTMSDDVNKLMDGHRANLMFTSPPYNAGVEVKVGHSDHKYENHDDAMSGGSYLNLLNDFTSLALIHCDMVCVNIQQLAGNKIQFIEYLNHFKNNFIDVAIWNKTYGTPTLPHRVMNCAFEYLIFLSSEDNPPRTIKTAPDFHGNIQNVYTAPKQTRNEYSDVHRATFPFHLPEHIINEFSTGSVLDLFVGTGTTLIACEKLHRTFFGMELDPLYVDLTVKRWEEYTGRNAELFNG